MTIDKTGMSVKQMTRLSKGTRYMIIDSTETSLLTSCGAELDFAGGAPRVIFHVESDEEDDRYIASPRPVLLGKKDEEKEPMFPFSIKVISKQPRLWRRNLQDFRMRLHYAEHFQIKIMTATMRALLYWVFTMCPLLKGRSGGRDIMRLIATFLPPSRKRKIFAYPVVNPMEIGEYKGLSLLERRSPSPKPVGKKIAKQPPRTPSVTPVGKPTVSRSVSPVPVRPLEKRLRKKRVLKKEKLKLKQNSKTQELNSPRPIASKWRP